MLNTLFISTFNLPGLSVNLSELSYSFKDLRMEISSKCVFRAKTFQKVIHDRIKRSDKIFSVICKLPFNPYLGFFFRAPLVPSVVVGSGSTSSGSLSKSWPTRTNGIPVRRMKRMYFSYAILLHARRGNRSKTPSATFIDGVRRKEKVLGLERDSHNRRDFLRQVDSGRRRRIFDPSLPWEWRTNIKSRTMFEVHISFTQGCI